MMQAWNALRKSGKVWRLEIVYNHKWTHVYGISKKFPTI